ncbi:MAG: hypothetical protein HYS22_04290 [Deltaproteobacteria bacterium]|nr:hypothetical protein [Deltaproteobacteria bacterium]
MGFQGIPPKGAGGGPVLYCSEAFDPKDPQDLTTLESPPSWSEERPEDQITPASLEEAIGIGYRQRGFAAQDEAIRAAEETVQGAQDSYFALVRRSSEYSTFDRRLLAAAARLHQAETELAHFQKDRRGTMTELVRSVFSQAAQRPVSEEETEEGFTAATYERVAIGFETVGERPEARHYYTAASRVAETMAGRAFYQVQALAQLDEEELADHRGEIARMFDSRLPALKALVLKQEGSDRNIGEDLAATTAFLSRLRQSGSVEEALAIEADFQRANPRAHTAALNNLSGNHQNPYTPEVSIEELKNAGYDLTHDLSLPPGSLWEVQKGRAEAFRLLHRIDGKGSSKGGSPKRLFETGERFDRMVRERLSETKGRLPVGEAYLYATLLGEMLIAATVRGGSFEKLLQENEREALDRQAALYANRVKTIGEQLRPYETGKTGKGVSHNGVSPKGASPDPVYEMRASLEMRLEFDGRMARHLYPEALDEALPYLMQVHGDSARVQDRLAVIAALYPDHFDRGCLVAGLDFSETEAGREAASREEAMFLTTGGYEEILYSMAAGVGGGAAGCGVAGFIGGAAGFFAPIPGGMVGGAAGGCKIGAVVGGGAAAAGLTYSRVRGKVEAHQEEIAAALQAGVSQVGRREAESYRLASRLTVGLNSLWGLPLGGVGAEAVRVGLRLAGNTVRLTKGALMALSSTPLAVERGALDLGALGLASLASLPRGTQAMIAGGTLLSADYLAIDEVSLEGVQWGADYHIDTVVGLAGTLLFGAGLGSRLFQSREFEKRFYQFLVEGRPQVATNPALYNGSLWARVWTEAGLLVEGGGTLQWAGFSTKEGVKRTLGAPFNALFQPLERWSVPVLAADFTVAQFTDTEGWDDSHGIRRTPHLSIVGGLALALAGGNRAAIRLFGIHPEAQRFYFALDRFLDMYMLHSSGNTNFLEADWYRVGMKYVSGWGVGQVRGNMLRFALARAYGNRFLEGVRLEIGNWRGPLRRLSEVGEAEKSLHAKLLEASDRLHCRVRLDRSGALIREDGKILTGLTPAEKEALVAVVNEGRVPGHRVANFEALFHGGAGSLLLAASPILNKRGIAAFSVLHDTVIGTTYDYVRGEYLLFGDGAGYALWTLLRSISILPVRTFLKIRFGWHSGAAVAIDQFPRMTIDPYFTNWTRLYAGAGLWWSHYDDQAVAPQDLGAFLAFHTGNDYWAANGIDSWNRNHFPLNALPGLGDPEEPVVDTFADGYRLLTEKLMKGNLDRDSMEMADILVSELMDEAKGRIAEKLNGVSLPHKVAGNGQTVVEHAEVYAAVAWAVRQAKGGSPKGGSPNPDAFSETFRRHGSWIEKVLGEEKPATPADVARLATKFGEFTWFGEKLRMIPGVGPSMPTWPEGRSKGYDLTQGDMVLFKE